MPKTKGKNAMRNHAIPGSKCDELTYNTIRELAKDRGGQAEVIRQALTLVLLFNERKMSVNGVSIIPSSDSAKFKLNNTYLEPYPHKRVKEISKLFKNLSSFVRYALFIFFMFDSEANKIYNQEKEKLLCQNKQS